MDAETREVLAGIYEQVRHNHERAIALTNSVLALVSAMERSSLEFQVKYAEAMSVQRQSERAEQDSLTLEIIDAGIKQLRSGS